jgi:hypothetical protein
MELKKLEEFVDTVYRIVGERYSDYFKYIIGGCHCFPATEWYGDILIAFKRVLNDDVINDKHIKEQIVDVTEQLSKGFGK